MIYKKIFIDSDIILDLLLKRIPFFNYSRALFNRSDEKTVTLYTSTLILANVHYIVAKAVNKNTAREYIKLLTELVYMLSFDSENIYSALNSEHIDFEDTIQYFIAEKHGCDLIITRNIKHYKKFTLPVLTAEKFLRTL